MNDTKNTTRTQGGEPRELYVHLVSHDDAPEIIMMNDGVTTQKLAGEFDESVSKVLQSRTAFRGFVGAICELFGYSTKSAWTEQIYETTENNR